MLFKGSRVSTLVLILSGLSFLTSTVVGMGLSMVVRAGVGRRSGGPGPFQARGGGGC